MLLKVQFCMHVELVLVMVMPVARRSWHLRPLQQRILLGEVLSWRSLKGEE